MAQKELLVQPSHIFLENKTSEGRERRTKEPSEQVFLLKPTLKHVLNFKYTYNTN